MTSGDAAAARSAPPVSRTAYVLDRLRRDIEYGDIAPGESLRQVDLAARYGVSPTPVREALRLLEAEHTISYSPHRGAIVAELDMTRMRDLYLLRSNVEGLATRVTVERITDEAIQRVEGLHADLRNSREEHGMNDDLAQMNRDFHLGIYSSGSKVISEYVTSLWRLFPRRVTMWQDPEISRIFVQQHQDIVNAIKDRDAPAAEKLMADHILTASSYRDSWQSWQKPGEDKPPRRRRK